MSEAASQQLAEDLCRILGEGLVIERVNGYEIHLTFGVNHKWGSEGFYVNLNKSDVFAVGGRWPQDANNRQHEPEDVDKAYIKVSKKRGVEGLAADIKKRFLPLYREQYALMVAKGVEADKKTAAFKAWYAEVRAAVGGRSSDAEESQKVIYPPPSTGIYKIFVQEDHSIRIETHNIPQAAAKELLAAFVAIGKKYPGK